MKIARFLPAILFFLCMPMLHAQVNCYETQRNKGIQLYNQGDYAAASKNFIAAKSCTDAPANNDLDAWIDKCVIVVRLSVKKLDFAASGSEEKCVEVTTNAKSFRAANAPSWCKVTQQGKTVYVSCEDNLEVAPREGKISISSGGKTTYLEVTQRSADLEMEFDPEELEFSSKAETLKVKVSSNVPGWAVETAPSWLVAARQEDTLVVTSYQNASSSLRTGELTLSASGQLFPFPVRQLPGDTVVTVNVKELVFPSEGDAMQVRVSGNVAGWKVEPSDNWISVQRYTDSVTIITKENPSVFSRHGAVRVSCGNKYDEVKVHQSPHVTPFTMPVSELSDSKEVSKEAIEVRSNPSNLRVFVDDTLIRYTPFSYHVDFEHHSLLMGFERREYLFNDKQEDIEFNPGTRFATITLSGSKSYGLMTGFVGKKSFGAFSHFQVPKPLVKEFGNQEDNWSGYHFSVGPFYRPIPYVGIYAGLGGAVYGSYEADRPWLPKTGLDYEMGVMGFYKNLALSMGMYASHQGEEWRYSFLFGLGGYLKRYYDDRFGYCASDSRRWWSLNYVTRPAVQGKGVMFGDLGKEIARGYVKTMYIYTDPTQNIDTLRSVEASAGILFTPVNGLIDVCLGVGAEVNIKGMEERFQGVGAELGVIMNFWRFPVMVMLHESDLFEQRKLYVDFGIGFHLGEFKRCSYK